MPNTYCYGPELTNVLSLIASTNCNVSRDWLVSASHEQYVVYFDQKKNSHPSFYKHDYL